MNPKFNFRNRYFFGLIRLYRSTVQCEAAAWRGLLWPCRFQVLRDITYVFAIFFVIYLSFALGILYMYKPFSYRGEDNSKNCSTKYCIKEQTIKGNKGMRGIFSLMFWKVFDGDASNATFQQQEEFNKTDSTRMKNLLEEKLQNTHRTIVEPES